MGRPEGDTRGLANTDGATAALVAAARAARTRSPHPSGSAAHPELGGAVSHGMARIGRFLGDRWVVLVAVIVVVISGTLVYRMHGIFGTTSQSGHSATGDVGQIRQFSVKRVLYEVEGSAGTNGSLSYLDENAAPHRADFTTLPWSLLVTTTLPAMFANLVVQGDSDTIGCRITVNGQVRDDQTAHGRDAQAFCLVKAA